MRTGLLTCENWPISDFVLETMRGSRMQEMAKMVENARRVEHKSYNKVTLWPYFKLCGWQSRIKVNMLKR